MAKYLRNAGKRWTEWEEKTLRALARMNTPTRVIGLKLGRSADAVYAKASRMGISLAPWNQSPYGSRRRAS